IVERALAKRPEQRYADAADFLRDVQRLQRGEPTGPDIHPRLPTSDTEGVQSYEFRWDLTSTPEQLWPLVSNTDRLNPAAGLVSVQFTTQVDDAGRVRRFGKARRLGLTVAWEEHPFEWIEARRFGVLREFREGPFQWLTSVVDLVPRGNGTTLFHRFKIKPS